MVYLVKRMSNLIEKKTYYSNLYSFYGNLLTEKQQEIFIAYYEEDYSLSEIAESFEISRNAVHDTLKKVCKNLEYFESKLELLKKSSLREELFNKYNNEYTKELIEKLKEMEWVKCLLKVYQNV